MTYDPQAESRSLMHKQRVLCNGQATGHPCTHYWSMIRIVPSHNPDFLKQGEKLRFCCAWGAEPLEFGDGTTELAVYCSKFKHDPSRHYDPDFEEYRPISDDDVVQIGLDKVKPNLPVPVSPLSPMPTGIGTTSTPVPAPAVTTSTAPEITAAQAAEEE